MWNFDNLNKRGMSYINITFFKSLRKTEKIDFNNFSNSYIIVLNEASKVIETQLIRHGSYNLIQNIYEKTL